MATAHVRSERDHIFGNQPKDITKIHTRNPKGLAEIHNQRLVEYITSGRLYKLRLMLEDEESELNVNCIDENQMTPLMVACSLDKEKGKTRDYIIRMLLKRGEYTIPLFTLINLNQGSYGLINFHQNVTEVHYSIAKVKNIVI